MNHCQEEIEWLDLFTRNSKMEARITFICYFYVLTSFNADKISALLHSANGCNAFPQSMQFLCYKIESLWANGASTPKAVNKEEERADTNPVKLVVSNNANDRSKNTIECSLENCEICHDKKKCKKCKYGYFLQFDPVNEIFTCGRKCKHGYRRHIDRNGNATCIKILIKECGIQNCVECLDSNTCSVCNRGYYPQFNADSERVICVKKCYMGYAISFDHRRRKSCTEIPKPAGCSDFLCMLCRRGYYMQPIKNGATPCLRRCPKGYLKDRIRRKCVYWPL